jgi:hypothetical protein
LGDCVRSCRRANLTTAEYDAGQGADVRPIRQLEIDFLCLAVFGQRALPDDMAARIAIARGGADAIADALRRNPFPDPRPDEPAPVEALSA